MASSISDVIARSGFEGDTCIISSAEYDASSFTEPMLFVYEPTKIPCSDRKSRRIAPAATSTVVIRPENIPPPLISWFTPYFAYAG